jgi:hypothetical protein
MLTETNIDFTPLLVLQASVLAKKLLKPRLLGINCENFNSPII